MAGTDFHPFLEVFSTGFWVFGQLRTPPPILPNPRRPTHPSLYIYIYIYKGGERVREERERERQGLVIFGGGPFWGFRPGGCCFLVLSVGSARSQLFMPGLHHAHTLQHTKEKLLDAHPRESVLNNLFDK